MGSCTGSGQRSCLLWFLSRTTSLGDVNTQVGNSCYPCEPKLFWSARDQSTGRKRCSGLGCVQGWGSLRQHGQTRALQRDCTDPQNQTLDREEEEEEWLPGAATKAAALAHPALVSLECSTKPHKHPGQGQGPKMEKTLRFSFPPLGSTPPSGSPTVWPSQLPRCPALLWSFHESGHPGKSCPISCALHRQGKAGITFLLLAWKSALKDHAVS